MLSLNDLLVNLLTRFGDATVKKLEPTMQAA
jgi:hypothetical protein